jgi:hypothetical protein
MATNESLPENQTEQLIAEGFGNQTYCLQCCGEYIQARDSGMPPAQRPAIQMSATWAPSWQTHTINGQMMMACVVIPSCFDHLGNRQKSAEEMAAGSGLFLGGSGR